MREFWREFWPWIVVPIVLVLAIAWAVSLVLGGEDGGSPFHYDVF